MRWPMCASPRCTAISRTSRHSTRRSSACAARAPWLLPMPRGAPTSATLPAPLAASSCRCCRRIRPPTMLRPPAGARNERHWSAASAAACAGAFTLMAAMFSDFDRFAMQRALTLAARGLESTDPNPRAGCVIAQRGRIVGEGWHERAGEAHAEVVALRAAASQAAGAAAYVTLEPCSHHGRTPPCVEALLAARVARVVYAIADPNPLVNGQGAAALRAAGITVEAGLLSQEAAALNAGFI